MAQSLDPDYQSQQRSESPAGSILRRLFTFWQHEDDIAPEVAPQIQPRHPGTPSVSSQAFTIWTCEASPAARVIGRSETGRLSYREFSGFTLWASARSEWLVEDRGPTRPPSAAFTIWASGDGLAALAARWDGPAAIRLPSSEAFSVWTEPGSLADLGARWGSRPLLQFPRSQAFSTWTDAAGLAGLAGRWERPVRAGSIQLSDPQPFSTWTRAEDLEAIVCRWSSPPDSPPIIRIDHAHPFSIWTEPAVSMAGDSGGLIHLEAPEAHSIWTTVEGLAAASARWIPRDASAKVAPIPASFAEPTPRTQPDPAGSKITPFPSTDTRHDTSPPPSPVPVDEFANLNNMEDNSTNKIQLKQSEAFTLWSSPEHWRTNTIAASAAGASKPAGSTTAETAPAAPADSADKAPSPEPPRALQPADTASDSSDTWKWAFALTLIGALGIIASQSAAIRTVKDNIEREVSSRQEVSKQLAAATSNNAELTDELTAKLALAETLANEKVDLEAAMKQETGILKETIGELKMQLSTKASQLEAMEAAVTSAKQKHETAASEVIALTKQMDDMGKALTVAKVETEKLGTQLKVQMDTAAELGAKAKELEAKLKGSQGDQQAMAKELSASADALSASLKQIADLKAKLTALESAPAETTE